MLLRLARAYRVLLFADFSQRGAQLLRAHSGCRLFFCLSLSDVLVHLLLLLFCERVESVRWISLIDGEARTQFLAELDIVPAPVVKVDGIGDNASDDGDTGKGDEGRPGDHGRRKVLRVGQW